ncbi:hypothetical protein HYPSUDRAFT_670559, partial [Hypholoma sublateritium FD-334 SS-4]
HCHDGGAAYHCVNQAGFLHPGEPRRAGAGVCMRAKLGGAPARGYARRRTHSRFALRQSVETILQCQVPRIDSGDAPARDFVGSLPRSLRARS